MNKLITLLFCALFAATGVAKADDASSNTITLLENPTTGYQWQYELSDDQTLTVTDLGYEELAHEDGLVGAGGVHRWSISAIGDGEAAIRFTLRQPWENGEVADTLLYTYLADGNGGVTLVATEGLAEQHMPGYAVIRLLENQTTGYQWRYKTDAEGILLPTEDYYDTTSGDDTVGAGGIHTWIFKGEQSGTVTLTFEYVRPWEDTPVPAATIHMTYQVDTALNVTSTLVDGDYDEYEPTLAWLPGE